MEQRQDNKLDSTRRGEYVSQIVEQVKIGSDHISLAIELAGVGAEAFSESRAGQFVQIACRGQEGESTSIKMGPTVLRRPFSIAGLGRKTGVDEGGKLHLEIIYRLVGPGTRWLVHQGGGRED